MMPVVNKHPAPLALLLAALLALGCEVDNRTLSVVSISLDGESAGSPTGGSGGGDAGGSGGAGGETAVATSAVVNACEIAECVADLSEAKGKADCDDGDPKTADRCFAIAPECGAICVHVPVFCDHYDSDVVQQALCDDSDPCTADRCDGHNTCGSTPIANCAL